MGRGDVGRGEIDRKEGERGEPGREPGEGEPGGIRVDCVGSGEGGGAATGGGTLRMNSWGS